MGYAETLDLADKDINENWDTYQQRFLRGDYPSKRETAGTIGTIGTVGTARSGKERSGAAVTAIITNPKGAPSRAHSVLFDM